MRGWMAALAALAFCAQTAPAGLFDPPDPEWVHVWHQPVIMASVDDAVKILVKLRKYYGNGTNHSTATVDMQVSPDEVRYLYVKNWVETGYQWVPNDVDGFIGGRYYSFSGGSSQPYVVEHSREGSAIIVPKKISDIQMFSTSNPLEGTYSWKIIVWQGQTGDVFGTGDQVTAQKLFDAFETLRVATWSETAPLAQSLGFSYWLAEKAVKTFKHLGWAREGGVAVSNVISGSPAALAGIKSDDVVYELTDPDGSAYPISEAEFANWSFPKTLIRLLGNKPSETFGLKVFRDGHDISVNITLTNANTSLKQFRANRAKAAQPVVAAAPASPPVRLGLSARELNEAETARAGGSGGVFVVGVDPGSLAEQMGFKPGDILLELNGTKLSGMASMGAVLAAGKVAAAKVLRKGAVLTLGGVTKF